MYMIFRIFAFTILTSVLLFSSPFQVSAALSGDLVSWGSWRAHGGAVVEDQQKTMLFDEASGEHQYVSEGISVAGYAGKYITLGAFSWAESSESVPKISGEVYNSQGVRVATVSGSSLLYHEHADHSWDVLSGTFPLPSSAKSLKLTVEQEGDQKGSEARVYKLEVRGVGSSLEGRAFINDTYHDRIPALVSAPAPVLETFQLERHEDAPRLVCSESRHAVKIAVDVTSFVYADDGDVDSRSESWSLWAANEDAWLWGNWGTGKALARSTDGHAAGYMCGKRGDEIRINGNFQDGDMYLVYRASVSRSAADQITDIRIDGESYSIGNGKDCWWDGNGAGGYDVVCKIQ